MPECGADTVSAGVAAADYDHVFACRGKYFPSARLESSKLLVFALKKSTAK
jgi:hypothetical protein